MQVGLPGTGIGTVFYMLLIAFMPLRELYFTVRGRSSLARWKTIGVQWSLCVSILAALAGEGWLLNRFFVWLQTQAPPGHAFIAPAMGAAAAVPIAAASPFIIIGAIFVGMHAMRLFMRRQQTPADVASRLQARKAQGLAEVG